MPLTIAARYGDSAGSPTLVVENKGIRIESTLPVAVYAHSEYSVGDRYELEMKFFAVSFTYSFSFDSSRKCF